MRVHPVYQIVVFTAKMMFRELFDGSIYGDENIPKHGPCLVACNHLSYFDPPLVCGAIHKREVFALGRSSLFRTKFRKWIFKNLNCIPLARESGDITAIKTALRLLKDGKCLMIFPEGTRSQDGSTGSPQAGVGMLACKTQVPVIPCKIFGTFEIMNRSSRIFDWNQKASIVFGKPLMANDYTPPGNTHDRYKVVATTIMQAIQNLQLPETRS